MSRLESNSINLRNSLESRNLYTPDNEYQLGTNKVVQTLNTLADILIPFKSIDVSNTLIGRLALNDSPLGKIGVKMLGVQLAYNVASNLQKKTLPVVNFNNLFDGDSNTKFISNAVDYTITVNQGASFISKVLDTLNNVTPIYSNPFVKNATNINFINNTGNAQLKIFYSQINQNRYKESDHAFINITSSKKFKLNNVANSIANKIWFTDQIKYPNFNNANKNVKQGIINEYNLYNTQEYGIIIDNKNNNKMFDPNNNTWIDSNNYGFNDDINNNIIWGRDGIDDSTNKISSQLRTETVISNDYSRFNTTGDLLYFTSQLLNASQGNIIDQTKKVFKDGSKLVGFNGSGVYVAPSDSLPEFQNKKGIRQHTVLDPYDNYTKAIRFNGNIEYNGNQNSVIYKSVIPKIAPSYNGTDIDNKNLMFSIENLAVDVIKDDKYKVGYLKDDYATVIPISEIGANNCRMMWFPPYGIEITENAIAKYTSTEFIGRGEPIYTYNNSERTATLTFKLIVDHPPQISQFKNNPDYHKRLSEFYSFGFNGTTNTQTNFAQSELKLKQLIQQKETLTNIQQINRPDITSFPQILISFENNVPDDNNINDVIQKMFDDNYEVTDKIIGNSSEGNSFGLNGVTAGIYNLSGNSQYNDPNIVTTFDKVIKNVLTDENLNFISIQLVGASSKLYDQNSKISESEYNKNLAQRRINSTKFFIKARYKIIHKKDLKDSVFVIINEGSTKADPKNATIERISEYDTKTERSVAINFIPNGAVNYKDIPTTSQNIADATTLDAEIAALKKQIDSIRSQSIQNTNEYYNEYTPDDTNNIGFKNVKKNKFIPGFNSQTPEDLHKRLTFLHQCTRQGNAIRKIGTNGATSSKNSVFGKQPICVLRIGDFFNTKIVIENIAITYEDNLWDMNPEGFGMQPMIANISMQLKVIGGQSLAGPISVLQNAVSFNYYANSTFKNTGTYATPSLIEALEFGDKNGITTLNSEKLNRQHNRDLIK